MAEESVNIQKLEKIVDVSTQLANVSRRMSQGSYTMGLVLEYDALLAELANLNESPLEEYEALVHNSDSTKVFDFNKVEVSDRCHTVVQNSKLKAVEINDPLIACIKTHTFQGNEGLFSILVSGGAIVDINFTPKDGQ